jgi:DnaJ-class molecular chaperone
MSSNDDEPEICKRCDGTGQTAHNGPLAYGQYNNQHGYHCPQPRIMIKCGRCNGTGKTKKRVSK